MGCSHAIPRASPKQANANSILLSPPIENGISRPFGCQETFWEQCRVLDKLGEGQYAEVYEVKYVSSGQSAALKLAKDTCCHREAEKEARIWKSISRHDHIVNLIDHFEIYGKCAIIMEKCECTLGQHIRDLPNASQTDTAQMFLQMTAAVAHLECLTIVHRDIKPDNFLCVDDAKVLKLCDFGFAALMPKFGQLFGTFGTPFYMSPEMAGKGYHNLQTDVWSLGVTFYLMLYGDFPYTANHMANSHSARNVMKVIATGCPEPRFDSTRNVSPAAKEGVAAMLNRSMLTRVAATQVLEMPFVKLACGQLPIKGPNGMIVESESTTTCGMSSHAYYISSMCSHFSRSQPLGDCNSPCNTISL